MLRVIRCGLLVAVALGLVCSESSPAQQPAEGLAPILDRAYIAHWLVCGPFTPDVPGGILAAIRDDAAVLSSTDFMAPAGGIARLRPRHLMRVATPEGGEAIWQEAGTTGPELDLAPFFPGEMVGLAYAAFYVASPGQTQILLDIESPLGVRIWANGFPVADYQPGPVDGVGKDHVAVGLRRGDNLVVFEVPGADYTAMARARSLSVPQLTAGVMANRPRLRKTSGFALSLKLYNARPLGDKLLYVPRLENAGTFSGIVDDLKQDVWLTLHNPTEETSEAVDAIITVPGQPLPDLVEVEALDPGETRRIRVALPIEGDSAISASVRLRSGEATAAFSDTVEIDADISRQGLVRIVTGHTMAEGAGPDDDLAYLNDVKRQLIFRGQATGYGFDLGFAASWHKPFVGLPALRSEMGEGAQEGAVTVRSRYTPIDERVVGGTLLWRNLQIGLHMAGSLLHSTTPHFLAWDTPGIAPQTGQLLRYTPLVGMISNRETMGLYPLGNLYDLTGETHYLRHKNRATSPTTLDELLDAVALQRRELLALGINSDLLVLENVVPPPEPFYRGTIDDLARAFPQVRLDDGGGAAFFEELENFGDAVQAKIPTEAVNLNLGEPGGLLTLPTLQHAHQEAANQLEAAETLATLASLEGAVYPHGAMEFAWRQLLYYSTPDYLGVPETDEQVFDALAGFREVAEWSADGLNRSSAFIAKSIDTAGSVPLNQGDFQALVVFNPRSERATLPVVATLPIESPQGLQLVDSTGTAVPFIVRPYQGAQRMEFVADQLPPFGYATYFVTASGRLPSPIAGEDLQIENDHLALFVDPNTGALQSILNKATGEEVVAGLMNELMFLPEDERENRNATELWTRPPVDPMPKPARISSEHSDFRERITVETSVGSGTLLQRYTLFAGVPWIYCETEVDGVSLANRALVASFQMPNDGTSFVVGERFGALVGARGQDNLVLKTRGAENVGGTVSYPAYQWAAVSPNDAMQVGVDGVLPWEPTIIVYGDSPLLEKSARDLQHALITRGIPSIIHSDRPRKPDFLWTDGTTEQDSNDYLRSGYRMRVVLGSPDQNRFCEGLLAQLPADTVKQYIDRIPGGTRLLLHDAEVPAGIAPVPTLMLGGLTAAQSADLADDLSRAVRTAQPYLVPPSAYASPRVSKRAEQGCALFFPGAMSVSQQKDGRLLLGLLHRSGLDRRDSPGSRLVDDTVFRYAIYPFQGSWRDAGVPRRAAQYDTKPVSTVTGIHPGPLPVQQAFIEVVPEGLRVAGLKPKGFPTTTNTRTAFHPRDGYSLHAWEPTGNRWTGSLRTKGILEAHTADVLEAPRAPWSVSRAGVDLEVGGFQFLPLWFLPAKAKPIDGLARLGWDADPYGVLATRYWDERRGAAPVRKMPLGLLLRGALVGDSPTIEVVISNHTNDRLVQGSVVLEGTSGLSLGPQNFYYNLSPGEQHVAPIRTAKTPGMNGEIAMAAETEFERQTYRDVLSSNEAPFVLEIMRNGAQIRVRIRNNGSVYAKGYLDALVAPEHWSEWGDHPAVTLFPRRAAVSVPPFKTQTIIFSFSDPDARIPVTVKLAANGIVRYENVDATSDDGNVGEPVPTENTPIPPPPRRQQ